MTIQGVPEGVGKRFDAVRDRAKKLGVLDISFSKAGASDSLECYERTLDIVERYKDVFDHNAGETRD